jgi:hypothetical protein
VREAEGRESPGMSAALYVLKSGSNMCFLINLVTVNLESHGHGGQPYLGRTMDRRVHCTCIALIFVETKNPRVGYTYYLWVTKDTSANERVLSPQKRSCQPPRFRQSEASPFKRRAGSPGRSGDRLAPNLPGTVPPKKYCRVWCYRPLFAFDATVAIPRP